MTGNHKVKQSPETEPEMTQMLESAEKAFKITAINMFLKIE